MIDVETVKEIEEIINIYLLSVADRWEQGCDTESYALIKDMPDAPGNVSMQMIIDELRSRVMTSPLEKHLETLKLMQEKGATIDIQKIEELRAQLESE